MNTSKNKGSIRVDIMDLNKIDSLPYFLDVFGQNVKDDPDHIMLVDAKHDQAMTRAEADDISGRVYAWLTKQGIGREDFVLICLPRGAWAVTAMIGVWKAGAALVILEGDHAGERLKFIKKDCGCKAVIDLGTWQEIMNEQPKPGHAQTDMHDAAFAVYTSGSTGTPKGVLHEYGNIKLNALSVKNHDIKVKNDRVALVAPLYFVASTKTVLNLLYGTHTLYILPYSIAKNPVKLKKYYRDNKITGTFFSPSMIRALGADISPYLKIIHTGSEPANGISVPGVTLVNNYSMSESAFTITQFIIDKSYDVCPVGKPNYAGLEIHILDDEGNEVRPGESGEICFEAPFFRGYINSPEQTEKAFRGGLYHSSDLGKLNENGELVILGRAGDMIKINGNRIEPAEIEAAFKAVTGKQWCAAKGFEKPEQSFIAVYYQGELGKTVNELRTALEARLPYYMIPSYYVKIEQIPLLQSGKLDRKSLPMPEKTAELKEYAAPVTDTQKILCAAFEKVLGIERVGIHDNFYQIGGDSLGAMSVLAEADLDELSAIDIFEGCTPEGIAAIYERKLREAGEDDPEVIEKRERSRTHIPTANQVLLIDYQLFHPKRISLNLPFLYKFPPETDAERLCKAFNDVLRTHPIYATVFEIDDNGVIERYAPEKLPVIGITDMTEAEFDSKKDELVTYFKILGSPLVRGGIYRTESAVHLFVDMHHAITDGSSLQMFFGEIVKAYNGEQLPLDTYYTYLARDERIRSSEKYTEAEKYYHDTYGSEKWCSNFSSDTGAKADKYTPVMLSAIVTQEQMADFEKRTGISRNNFFAAVCLMTIAKVEGQENVMLNWVFHDRTDKVKQGAHGCLFRNIPIGVKIRGNESMKELMDEIVTRSNESIANSCYEWSILSDRVFKNDMLLMIYETADIMSSGKLKTLGAVNEQVNDHRDAPMRSVAVQILDLPQGIMVNLGLASSLFSAEKTELIKSTMESSIKNIINAI